jgi:hypothetical protein
MPRSIALLAVPAVLAAAVVTATGAFAKAPAHRAAGAPAALTNIAAKAKAPATAPATKPAEPITESTTESTNESATESATETTDAAGGHADDPNDPNADHQFEGEE